MRIGVAPNLVSACTMANQILNYILNAESSIEFAKTCNIV